MIISHKYKFIFIKTNKTAGTSMEIALSKYCGPNDVITPITPEDEVIRESLGYCRPQKYLAPISKYSIKDIKECFIKRQRKKTFYNHISAREVIKIIGEKKWNEYFTFCFERNPLDRFVSFYFWRNQNNNYKSVNDFLQSPLPLTLKERGYNLYTINDKIIVDHVGLYENLDKELKYIEDKLNLPEPIVLPKTKASYRPKELTAEKLLTKDEIAFLKHMFAQEIELFGY